MPKNENIQEESQVNEKELNVEETKVKSKKAKYHAAIQFRDKNDQVVYAPGDDYTPANSEREKLLLDKGVIKKKD